MKFAEKRTWPLFYQGLFTKKNHEDPLTCFKVIFQTYKQTDRQLVLTIVFKYLNSGLPHYFHSSIQPYSSSFNSRCSNPSKRYLSVPTFNNTVHKSKKQFDHSFSYDAPTLWNSLPDNVRFAPSVSTFRKRLKSYLFHLAYPP